MAYIRGFTIGWCQTGNKPLFEPMITQYTDAHMCYQATIS